METYLMMLYVTLDQESALKKFFDDRGWDFCKPDLSVTTDKLGPSISSKTKEPASVVLSGKRKAASSPRLAPQIKFVKVVSSNAGGEVKDLCFVPQDAKSCHVNEKEQLETRNLNTADTAMLDEVELDKKGISDKLVEEESKIESDNFNEDDYEEEVIGENIEQVVNDDIDDDVNNDLDDVGDEEIDDTDDSMEDISDDRTGEKLDGTNVYAEVENLKQNRTEVDAKRFPGQTIDEGDLAFVDKEDDIIPTNNEHKVTHTCEICGRQYLSKQTLMRHRKTHLCPFYCRSCTMAFDTDEEMTRHNIEKHSQNFSCPSCGKNFMRKNSLSVHFETIHSSLHRFPCTWPDCDKSFSRQDVLNDHVNTHTGVRPYTCQKCLKTYSSKSCLNHHWKACKTDGLACKICGQILSSRSGLADHIQGMHNKNPLPCVCGQVFTWRSNLLKHKKNCIAFHDSKS